MKYLRFLAQVVLTAGLMWGMVASLEAVVIEGTTPSGKFKTVGLSETGRFLVETTSGALQHVIVDSGTVTAFQGGVWTVNQGGVWTFTSTPGSVGITVQASTISVTVTGSGSVGGVAVGIYPADTDRKQGVICNGDPNLILLIGGAATQDMTLPAGSCYSPDVPSSFVGALYGKSTGPTVGYSYIYHK